ncbi:hypothetical protein ACIA8K_31275 [Catenuloplanes sp. NPDC051500]|uniref:hypothetical protein n=1 Tax=Catenuloplanes sp. NPDC051500 TaxID=3363959 RepID=UPI0037BE0986
MIGDWIQEQAAAFLAFRNEVVDSWQGVEMAVRGLDEGTPEYDGPDVPCLQLLALSAVKADGSAVGINTYQDDTGFGLWVTPGSIREGDDWSRGFRRRALTELPTGLVREVAVYLDADVLAEVSMKIADKEMSWLLESPMSNGRAGSNGGVLTNRCWYSPAGVRSSRCDGCQAVGIFSVLNDGRNLRYEPGRHSSYSPSEAAQRRFEGPCDRAPAVDRKRIGLRVRDYGTNGVGTNGVGGCERLAA